MRTRIVNLHTYKKSGVIRADRTTPFGNPFIMGKGSTREQVIAKHMAWLRAWFEDGEEIIINGRSNKWVCEHVYELRGWVVGCWCKPKPCHVDNLITLLQRMDWIP